MEGDYLRRVLTTRFSYFLPKEGLASWMTSEHDFIKGTSRFPYTILMKLTILTSFQNSNVYLDFNGRVLDCLLMLVIADGGLLWLFRLKRICLQCRRPRFNPRVGKILWRREWLPNPVLLPGESHGQRNLARYSPRGRKESDTTEQLTQTDRHTHIADGSSHHCKERG